MIFITPSNGATVNCADAVTRLENTASNGKKNTAVNRIISPRNHNVTGCEIGNNDGMHAPGWGIGAAAILQPFPMGQGSASNCHDVVTIQARLTNHQSAYTIVLIHWANQKRIKHMEALCLLIGAVLLIGTMGARMAKGVDMPRWLFYSLVVGFLVFVGAMIYSVLNP